MKKCVSLLLAALMILGMTAAFGAGGGLKAIGVSRCVTWVYKPERGTNYVADYYFTGEQPIPPDMLPTYENDRYFYAFLGWRLAGVKEILNYYDHQPGLGEYDEFVQEEIPVMKEKDMVFLAIFRLIDKELPEYELRDGVLTGTFYSLGENAEDYPWYEYRNEVRKIVVLGNAVRIGAHAFDGFENLEEVILPKTLTELGDYAFAHCPKLERIRFGAPMERVGEGALSESAAFPTIVLENQTEQDFKACAAISAHNINAGGASSGFDGAHYCTVYTYGAWRYIPRLTDAGSRAMLFDINKDGEADIADVSCLLNYLSSEDLDWAKVGYDVAGDGNINIGDVSELLNGLSGSCAHSLRKIDALDPTCAKEGHTAYCVCANCPALLSESETLDKLPHTPVRDPAVAPTCGTDGRTAGSHCKVCGTVLEQPQILPATGEHTPTVVPAAEPDCIHAGCTEGSRCAVCGKILVESQILPATGVHTPETDPAREADCTHCGLSEGSHCAVCGITLIEQTETGEALGHDFVNGVCTRCGASEETPDG